MIFFFTKGKCTYHSPWNSVVLHSHRGFRRHRRRRRRKSTTVDHKPPVFTSRATTLMTRIKAEIWFIFEDPLTTEVHQWPQAPAELLHPCNDIHTLTLEYRLLLGSGEFPLDNHSLPQEHPRTSSEGQAQTGTYMCGCRSVCHRRIVDCLHMSELRAQKCDYNF